MQDAYAARFGTPDSVRMLTGMGRAFYDGLAVFWQKPGWCAMLTIQTDPGRPEDPVREMSMFMGLTVERRGKGVWDLACIPTVGHV